MRYEKVWFKFPNSSLVKGAMNAARVCKLRNGANFYFLSIFNGQRWNKCAMNISAAI